jgi:hypothetical protein
MFLVLKRKLCCEINVENSQLSIISASYRCSHEEGSEFEKKAAEQF